MAEMPRLTGAGLVVEWKSTLIACSCGPSVISPRPACRPAGQSSSSRAGTSGLGVSNGASGRHGASLCEVLFRVAKWSAHGSSSGSEKAKNVVSSVTASTSQTRRLAVTTAPSRQTVRRRERETKAAPTRPPTTPSPTKMGSSRRSQSESEGRKAPKVMRPGWERAPKWSVRREERRMLSVKVEQSAQKKVRQVSGCDQYVAASSIAKSVPPIGAPNAAATPAAAPAETKSRLSWSLRKDLSHIVRTLRLFEDPCETPAAMMAPMWIIGPSLPTTSPLATAHSTPTDFASSASKRSIRGTLTPCRYALTSGMPEPPATGETQTTRPTATETKSKLIALIVASPATHAAAEPLELLSACVIACAATENLTSKSCSQMQSMAKARTPVPQPTAPQMSHRYRLSRRRYSSGCRSSSWWKSVDSSMS
mmetsp:Transcript_46660/g.146663  ORF Transcript_46660/g.146663 Transcript_46660/m.146663 type:complete len:423 (-) Transcript_46660:51-1319(-)